MGHLSMCSGSGCTDTVLITIGGQPKDPACSPGIYCITDSSGFYGKGVSLTPNGSGTWTWDCVGCTATETINVTFKGGTFKGTAKATDTVPYSGVLSTQGELVLAGKVERGPVFAA